MAEKFREFARETQLPLYAAQMLRAAKDLEEAARSNSLTLASDARVLEFPR